MRSLAVLMWPEALSLLCIIAIAFPRGVCATSAMDDVTGGKTYEVMFADHPMSASQVLSAKQELLYPMRKHDGSLYICQLPDENNSTIREKSNLFSTEPRPSLAKVGEEVPAVVTKPIEDQLSSRHSCAFISMGWWVYEVCWGRYVRQAHYLTQEGLARAVRMAGGEQPLWDEIKSPSDIAENYFLGLSENVRAHANVDRLSAVTPRELEEELQKMRAMDIRPHRFVLKDDGILNYLSTTYTDGTTCDVTKTQREVEMRVYCGVPGRKPPIRIEEVGSCRYAVTTELVTACIEELHVPTQHFGIVCYPVELS